MVGAVMYGIDTTVALPHLAAALRRQLEEYPDVRSGLSRTERQCCEALATGPITLAKLFETSSQASESWSFLGDWSFAWYVQRLSECARPLVEHTNGTSVFEHALQCCISCDIVGDSASANTPYRPMRARIRPACTRTPALSDDSMVPP